MFRVMGMDQEDSVSKHNDWFVMMNNGTIFGPINTIGLLHWAEEGRVMPDDEVSTDRTNWIRACELEELGMDTMLELPDGTFKGPYNPKAIDGLAREGTIPMRAVRFHKRELEERMATRQIYLFGDEAWEKSDDAVSEVVKQESNEQYEQQIEQIRQEAQDAIALAQRESEDLRTEREQILAEKTAIEAELASFKQQNAKNDQETSLTAEQIDTLLAEKASLELALESANQQSAINTQLIDDIVAEKLAVEEEKAALVAELATIKQQKAESSNETLNAECDELRKQAQELAQQLQGVEEERDALAAQLDAQNAVQLDAELGTTEQVVEKSVIETEEYIALLTEKESVEAALEETKSLAEQVTESLERAVKAHEEDVAEQQKLTAKIDALQEQATTMSAELAVAKENNELAKELLILAEGAKKELTDALSVELTNVEQKSRQVAELEEKCLLLEEKAKNLEEELVALRDVNNGVNEELSQIKEEYSELLDFSNERDTKNNEEISKLKEQLDERPEVVQTRREQMLESQLKLAMQESDTLREQLETLSAKKMTEDSYSEDDISLIKRYADESISVLRRTLEEEKEANLTARAKSVERQRVLHEELQRLERVMQRDPGELTRAEMSEQRANKQIAKLQQELESERRHHQADVARADANATALEQRYRMLMQKEAVVREQLSAAESRIADFDSVNNLLRRRETALLAAEKEFEEARQQWKMTEETLQRRIDELESGAGLLFDNRSINVNDAHPSKQVGKSSLSRIVLER